MYFDTVVPTVDVYMYLGVLLDIGLSLVPQLKCLISKGWSIFNDLLGAAFLHRLPVVVQASMVPSRVESACFYGIELCILVDDAERRLNRMQAGWAKSILGIGDTLQGHWPLLFVECGW